MAFLFVRGSGKMGITVEVGTLAACCAFFIMLDDGGFGMGSFCLRFEWSFSYQMHKD